ncbi:YscQ/HrcQ family type III secretion apparatus protein [Candidatus Fukatsuia endosymbiont of Tuberolachnus salignus]|uniref:YscQ/HrcQ family type III secretion apparatus protein n=1 Tax=Candidatus Fukatsuia endosymbiont of Tuberolachnus salignus TaxID=3077957 RepID=UPI00313BCE47
MPLNLSPELTSLSSLLGDGRTQNAVTVSLKVVEGAGVYLPVTLDRVSAGVWLPQQEWTDWLETVLAVPDASCLDEDLLVGVSHWALAPLTSVFLPLAVTDQLPREEHLLKQWAVVCTFSQEDRQFHAVLVDWPLRVLSQILADWPRNKSSASGERLPLQYQCGLVVGWCRLSLVQLQRIHVGDGLRLSAAADLEGGCCWLWQVAGPQIHIRLSEENQMTILNINQDIDELLELDSAALSPSKNQSVSLHQLPQTLTMEIGCLTLPTAKIGQLKVGQTLNCQSNHYGEVSIRLRGQPVGSGCLVSCDDELLVKIEQWWLTP